MTPTLPFTRNYTHTHTLCVCTLFPSSRIAGTKTRCLNEEWIVYICREILRVSVALSLSCLPPSPVFVCMRLFFKLQWKTGFLGCITFKFLGGWFDTRTVPFPILPRGTWQCDKCVWQCGVGTAVGIRTINLLVTSQTLYPPDHHHH